MEAWPEFPRAWGRHPAPGLVLEPGSGRQKVTVGVGGANARIKGRAVPGPGPFLFAFTG
jgi:hypothetical protein